MSSATRRLVQLQFSDDKDIKMLDMLLAKKSAERRRAWLENAGDLAEIS